MRKLKEFWCKEKYDFCRGDDSNQAHQEVIEILKQEIPMADINCKLEASDVILNEDTFVPYIDLTYRTRLSFEAIEARPILKHYGSDLEDLIVDEFKQLLTVKLNEILKKYGKGGDDGAKPVD